jgi:hypothetical protein
MRLVDAALFMQALNGDLPEGLQCRSYSRLVIGARTGLNTSQKSHSAITSGKQEPSKED